MMLYTYNPALGGFGQLSIEENNAIALEKSKAVVEFTKRVASAITNKGYPTSYTIDNPSTEVYQVVAIGHIKIPSLGNYSRAITYTNVQLNSINFDSFINGIISLAKYKAGIDTRTPITTETTQTSVRAASTTDDASRRTSGTTTSTTGGGVTDETAQDRAAEEVAQQVTQSSTSTQVQVDGGGGIGTGTLLLIGGAVALFFLMRK